MENAAGETENAQAANAAGLALVALKFALSRHLPERQKLNMT